MIIGLIPVGGKGLRLSLPYPKELLPQKGYDYFNPIINHTVEKLLSAGAEKIFFVHGKVTKSGIIHHYNEPSMIHLVQEVPGFANVIRDLYLAYPIKDEDKILFGLPDSVYSGNPFKGMLEYPGVVCGLFKSEPEVKVDRLLRNSEKLFQVKTQKTDENQDWFWGVLKFDGTDIKNIMLNNMLDTYTEIGDILNHYPVSCVYSGNYIDLGTWESYNKYLEM